MGLFTSKKKRLEMEERQRQAQKEAEETCAKEGHLWSKTPYWNSNFKYKDDLFECLPLDCCVEETCTRCGATRKARIEGVTDFTVTDIMKCPVLRQDKTTGQDKTVGEYHLKIDTSKSYCMRAKKEIPSAEINKGDVYLILEPQNNLYYSDEALSSLPFYKDKMPDEIIDNGDMPGLVELCKMLYFVDDDGQILSGAKIIAEIKNSDYVGTFKIEMLRVPAKGKLSLCCLIKE